MDNPSFTVSAIEPTYHYNPLKQQLRLHCRLCSKATSCALEVTSLRQALAKETLADLSCSSKGTLANVRIQQNIYLNLQASLQHLPSELTYVQ
jgi:hypothetical protein